MSVTPDRSRDIFHSTTTPARLTFWMETTSSGRTSSMLIRCAGASNTAYPCVDATILLEAKYFEEAAETDGSNAEPTLDSSSTLYLVASNASRISATVSITSSYCAGSAPIRAVLRPVEKLPACTSAPYSRATTSCKVIYNSNENVFLKNDSCKEYGTQVPRCHLLISC